MTMGNRIRTLRESRGMTQRQLAEAAGCTDAAIRNYEADRRVLKGSALDAIAGALEVAPEALMPVHVESSSESRRSSDSGPSATAGWQSKAMPKRRQSSRPPSRYGSLRGAPSTTEK